MIVLEGSRVRLRPFDLGEFDVFWGAVSGADPTVAIGNPNADGLRTRVETSGTLAERELLLAVEADRRLIGSIQAYREGTPAGVFELGIELFDEGDRGRGFGAEAVKLLLAYLFDSQGARRVEAGTADDNGAMRAALQGMGFREEGIRRRFYPSSDDRGVDCVMYGMTREDYQDVKTRWT